MCFFDYDIYIIYIYDIYIYVYKYISSFSNSLFIQDEEEKNSKFDLSVRYPNDVVTNITLWLKTIAYICV